MTKLDIYNLIYNKVNELPSDKDGIKHFQLEKSIINPHNPTYYHLDAAYIGIDKKLRFLTSSRKGNIVTPLEPKDIELTDLHNLYYKHLL